MDENISLENGVTDIAATSDLSPKPHAATGTRSDSPATCPPAPANVRQVDADATGDLLKDAESVQ